MENDKKVNTTKPEMVSKTRVNIIITIAITSVVIGGALLFFREYIIGRNLVGLKSYIIERISIISILFGGIIILFNYLQGTINIKAIEVLGLKGSQDDQDDERQTIDKTEIKAMVDRMKGIEDKIKENLSNFEKSDIKFTEDDKNGIINSIKKGIESDVSNRFLEEIELKYGSNILAATQLRDILKKLQRMVKRLEEQIRILSRRANANLAIGVMITAAAGIYLVINVLPGTENAENLKGLLSHYIPRISFIAFIEIFAFFFLKLYKGCLEDIKKYQIQLVSIEFKGVALQTSLMGKNDICLKTTIEKLAGNEPNEMENTYERTVEVEREKTDYKQVLSMLRDISSILKNMEVKK